MSARKRIRNYVPTVQGGGGGGPSPGGTIQWGPDFGGDNGDKFEVVSAMALTELALAGVMGSSAAVDLSHLALDYNLLSPAGTLTMPALEIVGNVGCDAGIDKLQFSTSNMIASKDTWFHDRAICTGADTNHDGEDLFVSGLAALERSTLAGWDFASLGSGTVTSAVFTINRKGAPLTAQSFDVWAAGSHTWSESTVSCSSDPGTAAGTSVAYTASGPAGDDVIDLSGNATLLSNASARMGVGDWTVKIQARAGGTEAIAYESKDEGTNDSLGPRLSLTWEVTL